MVMSPYPNSANGEGAARVPAIARGSQSLPLATAPAVAAVNFTNLRRDVCGETPISLLTSTTEVTMLFHNSVGFRGELGATRSLTLNQGDKRIAHSSREDFRIPIRPLHFNALYLSAA